MFLIGLKEAPCHIMSDLHRFLDGTALSYKPRHFVRRRKELSILNLFDVDAKRILFRHDAKDTAFFSGWVYPRHLEDEPRRISLRLLLIGTVGLLL